MVVMGRLRPDVVGWIEGWAAAWPSLGPQGERPSAPDRRPAARGRRRLGRGGRWRRGTRHDREHGHLITAGSETRPATADPELPPDRQAEHHDRWCHRSTERAATWTRTALRRSRLHEAQRTEHGQVAATAAHGHGRGVGEGDTEDAEERGDEAREAVDGRQPERPRRAARAGRSRSRSGGSARRPRARSTPSAAVTARPREQGSSSAQVPSNPMRLDAVTVEADAVRRQTPVVVDGQHGDPDDLQRGGCGHRGAG